MMITAFVFVSAEPARVADLATELADVDGVSEVYSVTGDEDLIVVLRVREHEDLSDVVTRHIAGFPGIRRTRTSIAFRAYSRHDIEAVFNIGSGD